MRKIKFQKEEYYHIYNRGVDKRSIFKNEQDVLRFLYSMEQFNSTEPISSLTLSIKKQKRSLAPKLVEFIAYCLNQNHYHFILKPVKDDGIQLFMHKLSTGYTNFFNKKNDRSGSLFQGPYKAVHIKNNEQLIHTSVYVNLNDQVHSGLNQFWMAKLPISSYSQYKGEANGFCNVSVILDQYDNPAEYSQSAESILADILTRKEKQKDLKKLVLEE